MLKFKGPPDFAIYCCVYYKQALVAGLSLSGLRLELALGLLPVASRDGCRGLGANIDNKLTP